MLIFMTTMLLIYSEHNVEEAPYSETSLTVYKTTRPKISQHSIAVSYIYEYIRHREVALVWFYSFFNLNTRWEGWLTPRPGSFTPENDPVPVYEPTWASGTV